MVGTCVVLGCVQPTAQVLEVADWQCGMHRVTLRLSESYARC